MSITDRSPLYIYVDENVQKFLTSIKETYGISKSDAIQLVFTYIENEKGKEFVENLFNDYLIYGSEAM